MQKFKIPIINFVVIQAVIGVKVIDTIGSWYEKECRITKSK